MRRHALAAVLLLAGCAGGGPPPPEWRANLSGAMQGFERHYLAGDTALAEKEFARAKTEAGKSGRLDLLARLELVRCAARTASLEFDDCPGFEALRAYAAAAETAYAEWLAGRGARGEAPTRDDALGALVAAGVRFRQSALPPEGIAAAVETASAQGWRRPLLAWLGVQLKRAEQSGDRAAAEYLRRRIEVAGGR